MANGASINMSVNTEAFGAAITLFEALARVIERDTGSPPTYWLQALEKLAADEEVSKGGLKQDAFDGELVMHIEASDKFKALMAEMQVIVQANQNIRAFAEREQAATS